MEYDDRGRIRGVSQRDRKIEAAKGYLSTHPDASNAEVSLACGISDRTVTNARQQLIAAGVLSPSHRGRPPSPPTSRPGSPPPTPETPEDVVTIGIAELAALEADIAPLDREGRRRRLTAIAMHPKTPIAAQIAALRELEATEDRGEEQLGPPPPQTREERVTRVALMIEALNDFDGPLACEEAWTRGTGIVIKHWDEKGPVDGPR